MGKTRRDPGSGDPESESSFPEHCHHIVIQSDSDTIIRPVIEHNQSADSHLLIIFDVESSLVAAFLNPTQKKLCYAVWVEITS